MSRRKRKGRFLGLLKRMHKVGADVSEIIDDNEGGLRAANKALSALKVAKNGDRGGPLEASTERKLAKLRRVLEDLRRAEGKNRLGAIRLQQDARWILQKVRRKRASFPIGLARRILAGPKANIRLRRQKRVRK